MGWDFYKIKSHEIPDYIRSSLKNLARFVYEIRQKKLTPDTSATVKI